MSTKVLAQNATDLASSGFNVDSMDAPRVYTIVEALAKTKHGGYSFQPGVLFTKACKEVKSLAGIPKNDRLPEQVAKMIQDAVAKLPLSLNTQLEIDGYQFIKQSGYKINVSSRDGVSRRINRTYEKIASLEGQEKDLKWLVITTEDKQSLVMRAAPRDMEHRQRLDNQYEAMGKKLDQYKRMLKYIQFEIAEQHKATVEDKK